MTRSIQIVIEYACTINYIVARSVCRLINILSVADKTCLVWGKTCSGTGNCWLYNGETLRYLLNFTAASECPARLLFEG